MQAVQADAVIIGQTKQSFTMSMCKLHWLMKRNNNKKELTMKVGRVCPACGSYMMVCAMYI